MTISKFYRYTVFAMAVMLCSMVISLNASAKPVIESVTIINNKDIVHIYADAKGSTIAGYYVGSSSNISKAMFISSNATGLNLSLMGGTQYIWVKDANGDISDPYTIDMVNSCVEESVPKNATSDGRFKKCGIYSNSAPPGLVNNDSIEGLCADGYSLEYLNSSSVCNTMSDKDLNPYNVGYRYCQITFSYKCSKDSGEGGSGGESGGGTEPQKVTSYLKSLSLSSGTLNPSFKPATYNYSATVNASSVTINATLNSDGSSFVDGYGPKTYNLNYGLNTIYIKVKSKTNNITTYTLKITRPDGRNTDNSLSSLSVSTGNLEPAFNKGNLNYKVKVDNKTDKITVDATVNNSKSSFVSGFGPRTVNLKEGTNKIEIKVKSESGATKTYTVNVEREKSGSGDVDPEPKPPIEEPEKEEDLALLKSIELSAGSIKFEEKKFEYTVYVEYEINQVLAKAEPKDASDKVTIKGGENLEVGKETPITIEVYNEKNKFTRTYTINVIRKEENLVVSSNSKLASLEIKDHKISFDEDTTEYKIVLKKNEDKLDITAVPADEKSTVNIIGNESLKKGSEITIEVTAEDGSVTKYVIVVSSVSKGTNVVLVIILIFIIILVIAYIVLRLMGYRIYFNFSLIGSFFRTIGEKIKNIFDR